MGVGVNYEGGGARSCGELLTSHADVGPRLLERLLLLDRIAERLGCVENALAALRKRRARGPVVGICLVPGLRRALDAVLRRRRGRSTAGDALGSQAERLVHDAAR